MGEDQDKTEIESLKHLRNYLMGLKNGAYDRKKNGEINQKNVAKRKEYECFEIDRIIQVLREMIEN